MSLIIVIMSQPISKCKLYLKYYANVVSYISVKLVGRDDKAKKNLVHLVTMIYVAK